MKSKLTAFFIFSTMGLVPSAFVSQATALIDSDPRLKDNSFVAENPHLVFGDGFEAGCWRADIISEGNAPAGCEDGSIGELWHRAQFQHPDAARIVENPHPVRAGKYALTLIWRKNLVEIDEDGKLEETSGKAMLYGPASAQARQASRWYGFSVLLPVGGVRKEDCGHMFFQINGSPDKALGEAVRHPIFSLSYDSETRGFKGLHSFDADKRSAGNANIDKNATFFEIPRPTRRNFTDLWIDFVVHLVNDWTGGGQVQVWMNGKMVYEAKDIAVGFNDDVGPYPGFGLSYSENIPYNRNHWIFMDEIRIGGAEATYKDVAPFQP